MHAQTNIKYFDLSGPYDAPLRGKNKCWMQQGRKYSKQNSNTQRQEAPESGSLLFCLNTATKQCK